MIQFNKLTLMYLPYLSNNSYLISKENFLVFDILAKYFTNGIPIVLIITNHVMQPLDNVLTYIKKNLKSNFTCNLYIYIYI